jgi:hypothetical protein
VPIERAELVLKVQLATPEELAAHDGMLAGIAAQAGRPALWRLLADAAERALLESRPAA